MPDSRPHVLSIAGFDPSAGAGVLADVKTFEHCNVSGMGVISALTVQNDLEFKKVEWLKISQIIEQIEMLQRRTQFEFIKIGLIENLETLIQIIEYIRINPESHPDSYRDPNPKIIWDPILKASAGFEFHKNVNRELLEKVCGQLYLITPNVPEALLLGQYADAEKNAEYLSRFCNVYLKGGHKQDKPGLDILYTADGKRIELQPGSGNVFPKHGSGCVLSSAIAAGLAKGLEMEHACAEAKKYVTGFLESNDSLLGYHSGSIIAEHG
jgi:hydroxymethylpyrimidine/phosphomethylpyrimidine kinase